MYVYYATARRFFYERPQYAMMRCGVALCANRICFCALFVFFRWFFALVVDLITRAFRIFSLTLTWIGVWWCWHSISIMIFGGCRRCDDRFWIIVCCCRGIIGVLSVIIGTGVTCWASHLNNLYLYMQIYISHHKRTKRTQFTHNSMFCHKPQRSGRLKNRQRTVWPLSEMDEPNTSNQWHFGRTNSDRWCAQSMLVWMFGATLWFVSALQFSIEHIFYFILYFT